MPRLPLPLQVLLAALVAAASVAGLPIPTPEGVIETTPYTDARWTESPQKIPGRLWFAYADKEPEVRCSVCYCRCCWLDSTPCH